ncbi:hypothetical protein BU23DRAFT_330325 [Bimuria novae-zelandiae CBS 107.79]|uniref:Uncharacterized protein n=1 Tax=Bimuria novae-zelandiae CBS 107.79 TaxID=1447943 RepID=A0A6A5UNG9_9PLEO|nr:hypothetical protein BU23DRAFT_330325 [Bimuria novae-zelandiae CBS 107.79]
MLLTSMVPFHRALFNPRFLCLWRWTSTKIASRQSLIPILLYNSAFLTSTSVAFVYVHLAAGLLFPLLLGG